MGEIGDTGPMGAIGATGPTGPAGIGTLLCASTKEATILTCDNSGNPRTGVLLGANATQDGIPMAYPSLTLSYENGFPNTAWLLPKKVTITDLSLYIVTDQKHELTEQKITFFATIWISQKPDDIFVPLPDATVITTPLSGTLEPGSHVAATAHLKQPYQFTALTRFICIVGMTNETQKEQNISALINIGIVLQ
jgi:hypothetical protein